MSPRNRRPARPDPSRSREGGGGPGRSDRYVIPGRQPVREAIRAGRDLEAVIIDTRQVDALADLAQAAADAGVTLRTASRDELDALTGEVRHQGVVALAGPFAYASMDRLATAHLVLVLDGVTDPRNLGAIARVAEQAGAGGIVIRSKRAASPSPAAEKAAAGALSWVPVVVATNITRAVEELRDHGLWSLGLAGEAPRTVWDEPLLDERVALVIGEEGAGLSRLVAERVDALVSIPMAGRLDSLNAATATAVTAFEWSRRHHGK